MTRRMSDAGRELLRRLEGVRHRRYLDEGGLPTIGVGHLIRAGEHFDEPLTDAQVDELLRLDLKRFEEAVEEAVKVPLTQHQFDALVSFSFNVGEAALRRSSLLVKLNLGRHDEVPGELRKWARVGARVSPGLQKRREAEVRWWSTPDEEPVAKGGDTSALPPEGLMTPASGTCGGS